MANGENSAWEKRLERARTDGTISEDEQKALAAHGDGSDFSGSGEEYNMAAAISGRNKLGAAEALNRGR